ncbi:MAG: hypothetical protein U0166_05955 [Acidobacteriota bacterium]
MTRRRIALLIAPLCLLSGLCGPLPLKKPISVPVQPPGYAVSGRRIVFQTPAFTVAAEPLDDQGAQRFFREHTGQDVNPFRIPSGPGYQVFLVTVVNSGRVDLNFNAVYATMSAEGKFLYHLPPHELAVEMAPMFPDVDLNALFSAAVYDESAVINPKHYTSRLLVFYPLEPDVRRFVLMFSNVAYGESSTEVAFPFEVMETDKWQGKAAEPLVMPAALKEQKD